MDLIDKVCSTLPKNRESFVSHVIKEEEKFRKNDHIADNETEPVIIKYCSSSESDSDSVWKISKLPLSFCAKLYALYCSKSYIILHFTSFRCSSKFVKFSFWFQKYKILCFILYIIADCCCNFSIAAVICKKSLFSFLRLSVSFISTISQAVLHIVFAEITNIEINFALILENSSLPK